VDLQASLQISPHSDEVWEKLVTPLTSATVDRFSLVEGGPIYRFQQAIGMALPDRHGVVKRALLTTLVTWFPLLLLSLIQNRALNADVTIPFLFDFAAGIRFLIGLPLLVVAEFMIDPSLSHCVKHFVKSGLVAPDDLPAFEDVIAKTHKLRDSFLPVLVILVMALAPSIWYRETELMKNGISTWHTVATSHGDSPSLAGWWFGLISLPLYRVFLFRWVWMVFLWAYFLRGVTKIRLNCIGTHPDTCGGLAFLAEAQILFGFVAFAASAVVAGAFGNAIAYQGATISSLKFLIITFCALVIIVFACPLLILTPKLVRVKLASLHKYAALGTAYVGAFDAKWIQGSGSDREPLLGTADIQSLADLSNSFSVIREMRILLIDKRVLIGLGIPAIFPMIPLIIIATPIDTIVRAVLKLLI
jgi:hypothetical protein